MKFIYIASLIFLIPIFQYTFIPFISLHHFMPDLFLIMTIYFSITECTYNKGYLFALGLGLIQDLIGGGIPGTNILSKGLLSLCVEILAGRLLKINIITQIFFFFIGTILDISIGFAVANNYLKDLPTQGFFIRQVLVMFGLNTLLGIPVIFFLNKLEYSLKFRKKPSYYADI